MLSSPNSLNIYYLIHAENSVAGRNILIASMPLATCSAILEPVPLALNTFKNHVAVGKSEKWLDALSQTAASCVSKSAVALLVVVLITVSKSAMRVIAVNALNAP